MTEEAYNADITFGTNNDLARLLRDNMSISPQDLVQRGHNYAMLTKWTLCLLTMPELSYNFRTGSQGEDHCSTSLSREWKYRQRSEKTGK